jgi:hypothetical protein
VYQRFSTNAPLIMWWGQLISLFTLAFVWPSSWYPFVFVWVVLVAEVIASMAALEWFYACHRAIDQRDGAVAEYELKLEAIREQRDYLNHQLTEVLRQNTHWTDPVSYSSGFPSLPGTHEHVVCMRCTGLHPVDRKHSCTPAPIGMSYPEGDPLTRIQYPSEARHDV